MPNPRHQQKCDECRAADPYGRGKVKEKSKPANGSNINLDDFLLDDGELDFSKFKKLPYSDEIIGLLNQHKKMKEIQQKGIEVDAKRQAVHIYSGRFVDSMETTLFFHQTLGQAVNWVKELSEMNHTLAAKFEGVGVEKAKQILEWITELGMNKFEEVLGDYEEDLERLRNRAQDKSSRGSGGSERRRKVRKVHSA